MLLFGVACCLLFSAVGFDVVFCCCCLNVWCCLCVCALVMLMYIYVVQATAAAFVQGTSCVCLFVSFRHPSCFALVSHCHSVGFLRCFH